jgi:multidrug efflux pump subunit AcrA (membrane-fusion protein)
MRNLIYISLIGLFISSCDADKAATTQELIQSGDKELMNNRKQELSKQAETIALELGSLNQALENLKGTKDYPLITSYTVGTYDFSHYIDIQGDVATKQNIILFPEFSGILTQVYVREGDRVKKEPTVGKD